MLIKQQQLRKTKKRFTFHDASTPQRIIRNINKCRLKQFIRKLMLTLQFIRELKMVTEQLRIQSNEYIYRRQQVLPLYPDDTVFFIWTRLIDVMQLICAIVFPFYVCFIQYRNDCDWTIVILMIQIILLMDIIFNFISCHVDQNNNLIHTFKTISQYYLTQWFIFDLISTIPFELVFSYPPSQTFHTLDYYQLLKFIPVLKYLIHTRRIHYKQSSETIRRSQLNTEESFFVTQPLITINLQYLKLASIISHMVLLTHIFTSLWFFLLRYHNTAHLQDDLLTQYIRSFYWASQTITVVGYGEFSYFTNTQLTLIVIWLLVGVGFYSITIGNIVNIMAQSNSQQEIQSQLIILDNMFHQIQMPDHIRNDLESFIWYNIANNPFWNPQSTTLLNQLHPYIRRYATLAAGIKIIANITFFRLDVNFTYEMLPHTLLICFSQYQSIYRIGQSSNELYYLLKGEVRITNSDGHSLLNIYEGTIFGELEYVQQIARQYHAYASQNSIIVICPGGLFYRKISKDELLQFEFNELYLRRKILMEEANKQSKCIYTILVIVEQRKQLRRSSAVIHNDKLIAYHTQQAQRVNQLEFIKRIDRRTYQEYQQDLLMEVIGKKALHRIQVRSRFQKVNQSLISYFRLFIILWLLKKTKNYNQQKKNQWQYRSNMMGMKMLKNFQRVCRNEINIKKFLDQNKQVSMDRLFKVKLATIYHQSKQQKQREPRKMTLCISKWCQEINDQIQAEKKEKKRALDIKRQYGLDLIRISVNNSLKDIFDNLAVLRMASMQESMVKFELMELQRDLDQQLIDIQKIILKTQ